MSVYIGMCKHILWLTFLFYQATVFSQQYSKIPSAPIPTGTIQIRSNFFMDETEVTNIHWLEYLFYLQKEDSLAYIQALPDTSVWKNQAIAELGSYRAFYLRYPGFRYHPVVGINYKQAQNYCKWRSAMVTAQFKLQKGQQYDDWDIRFHYRLPTALEWEEVAVQTEKEIERQAQALPEYVYTSSPNHLGLYGIQNNVAEIVAHQIVKGPIASIWFKKAPSTTEVPFVMPDYFTGFRCACEVEMYFAPPAPSKHDDSPSFNRSPSPSTLPVLSPSQLPEITVSDTSSHLSIQFPWKSDFQKLSIFNAQNMLIAAYPLHTTYHQTINLGRFAPGIYLIRVHDGTSLFEQKVTLNTL